MPWVITRMCRDCVDMSCVEVCPVECIYQYKGEDADGFPNQLYIHPDECIDCGACEPECPWEAIFEDSAVPDVFKDDISLNAKTVGIEGELVVPKHDDKSTPSPDEVAKNKAKWGMT